MCTVCSALRLAQPSILSADPNIQRLAGMGTVARSIVVLPAKPGDPALFSGSIAVAAMKSVPEVGPARMAGVAGLSQASSWAIPAPKKSPSS